MLCASAFGLDRNAFTFTNYDLRVRVTPAAHGFKAEGRIILRNDSPEPQRNLSLQISSSLSWTSLLLNGKPLTYVTQPYESDIDHTGAVTEAIVNLPQEVAPKQTLELQVSYAGTVVGDSTRLTRIGAPASLALRNDWDRISADFTAVRGVGYVCWYPVAMDSISLSEGNRYFDVLGLWKERHAGSTMTLAIEADGEKMIIANGHLTGARAHAPLNQNQGATREADFSFAPFGLYPPSFTIANYSTLNRPTISIAYLKEHRAAAEEFVLAAEKVLPFITGWFGPEHEKVQVVELLDAEASPFDSGSVVFTPLRTTDRARLEVELAHQLAHACGPAGVTRPWIAEGLAQFAQALVRENQQNRKAALDWMNNFLPALQAAEKQAISPEAPSAQTGASSTPGLASAGSTPSGTPPAAAEKSPTATGQPLIRATDPTYYSIKAMYVWWMLRDMLGENALQHAIQAYRPAQDKEPSYVQRLVETQAKRNLEWFFDDWVYRDRGLPDFRIVSGFVRTMLADNISVTLTVEDLDGASAEVPVFVRAEKSEVSTRMLVKAKSSAVQRVQMPTSPDLAIVNDGSVPESDTTNNEYKFPVSAKPQ